MNNLDPPTTQLPLMLPATKMTSNHPGGVIVGFCGGNHKFMKSDIDPMIYMQLMTPSDREVGGAVRSNILLGIRDPRSLLTPKLCLPLDEAKIP